MSIWRSAEAVQTVPVDLGKGGPALSLGSNVRPLSLGAQ
jgi:hypothetical protein